MVSTDLHRPQEVSKSVYYYSMRFNIFIDLTDEPSLGSLIFALQRVEKEGRKIFMERIDKEAYRKIREHGHEDVKAVIHTVNEHHICVWFYMIHCGCGDVVG